MDETAPPIACTLTEEQDAERPEAVQSTLRETHSRTVDLDDGYTFVFGGTDEALPAVATFVSNELVCCSFADYSIDVSPPYEETRLSITGPAGTKAVFAELVEKFESQPA